MQKKIAGLILRPSPARTAEGGRVKVRLRAVQHRRESRPPPERAGRREAEDLFCQLAHDWLYATHAKDYPDYHSDDLEPEAALVRYLATSTRVGEQVTDCFEWMTVALAAQFYAKAQSEWARRSAYPLVIHQSGRFRRNPPPRRFDAFDPSVFRDVLAILENAGARPTPRRLEA